MNLPVRRLPSGHFATVNESDGDTVDIFDSESEASSAEYFVRDGRWVKLIWVDGEGRRHDHRIGSLCDPCMDDLDSDAEIASTIGGIESDSERVAKKYGW